MDMRQTLQKVLPLGKYLLFLHLTVVDFPYLYVDALRCYVNRGYAIVFFFLLSAALDYFVTENRYLKKSGWGKTFSAGLTVELFCLFLFAQYHFFVSVGLAAVLIVFSVWCYRSIYWSKPGRQKYRRYRRLCRQKAVSVICCAAAALFLIPAGAGIFLERDNAISLEEWRIFVETFNETAEPEAGDSVFDKYQATLDELNDWESLSRKKRLDLMSKIGLMEEEYLGIETEIPIVISSKKMDKYTCAYYEDDTKEIRINVYHLDNASLEENITTVLHEVFHAYQHNVVDHLDFSSATVQKSYYYADARAWRDNMDNYISGYYDFNAYEAQPLEADARAYSEQRVHDYLAQMS